MGSRSKLRRLRQLKNGEMVRNWIRSRCSGCEQPTEANQHPSINITPCLSTGLL